MPIDHAHEPRARRTAATTGHDFPSDRGGTDSARVLIASHAENRTAQRREAPGYCRALARAQWRSTGQSDDERTRPVRREDPQEGEERLHHGRVLASWAVTAHAVVGKPKLARGRVERRTAAGGARKPVAWCECGVGCGRGFVASRRALPLPAAGVRPGRERGVVPARARPVRAPRGTGALHHVAVGARAVPGRAVGRTPG